MSGSESSNAPENTGSSGDPSRQPRLIDPSALAIRDQAILASGTGILLAEYWQGTLHVVYANPAAIKMTGHSAEELLGRSFFNLLLPGNKRESLDAILLAMQERRHHLAELEFLQPSGGRLWCSLDFSPLAPLSEEMRAGDAETWVIIQSDITERLRVQALLRETNLQLEQRIEERTRALRQSEERFRSIVNSLDEIVFCSFPEESEPQFISPMAARILGRPMNEITEGRGLEAFVVPEDRAVYDEFKQRLFSLGAASVDYRVQRADGSLRWLNHRARIVRDEDGKLLRIDGTALDITERKRTEAELLSAREAADAANHAKSEFLAIMSHEIRTPMQCVFGYADLLHASGLNEQQRKYVDIVRAQAQSLLNILNDILDYSKLQAGNIELEEIPFSPVQVVLQALDIMRPLAAPKQLKLLSEPSHGLPRAVLGDPARLKQILINLISNAVKFTASGSVTVELELVQEQRVSHEPLRLRFRVRDTGPGIPPERKERLFKTFSQLDASISRRYGGTGLGLAICKRLCEWMGGKIDGENLPEGGALFTFEILVRPIPAPITVARASTDSRPQEQEEFQAEPLSVLVADDNGVAREMTRQLLELSGYRPLCVADGKQAVAAMERQHFDVVLLDLLMPEQDGFETARLIRELFPERKLQIIALTGNVTVSDRERCLELGMNEFIPKPVTLSALQHELQKAAQRLNNQ